MGYITKKTLFTEDPDTGSEDIIYSVTSHPQYGHIEVLDREEEFRTTDKFSQGTFGRKFLKSPCNFEYH